MKEFIVLLAVVAVGAFNIWWSRRTDARQKEQLERCEAILDKARPIASGETLGSIKYQVVSWGGNEYAIRKRILEYSDGAVISIYKGPDAGPMSEAEAARLNAAVKPAPPEVAS